MPFAMPDVTRRRAIGQILLLSARTRTALDASASRLAEYLRGAAQAPFGVERLQQHRAIFERRFGEFADLDRLARARHDSGENRHGALE